jgi:hypothetical protein
VDGEIEVDNEEDMALGKETSVKMVDDINASAKNQESGSLSQEGIASLLFGIVFSAILFL